MIRLHPDIAVANLSRPIPSRTARNNSLGTATSVIWKIICREWRTTFALILISFSRNVAHAALDAAVLAAYGYSAIKDLLAQLLALNQQVAAKIENGEPATAH